ncbi:hypothetical protein PENTCL1PPCAC_29933, partial [Pristionchus entomophagus]
AMEYEEALQIRENEDDFSSADPVKRSYMVFLSLMKPVFSNAYPAVLAHVMYPFLFGLILLWMFATLKMKFKESWEHVQAFISPFLWIVFCCQSIRWCFFVHNLNIGSDRIPTSRAVCSLATYAFSALNYL